MRKSTIFIFLMLATASNIQCMTSREDQQVQFDSHITRFNKPGRSLDQLKQIYKAAKEDFATLNLLDRKVLQDELNRMEAEIKKREAAEKPAKETAGLEDKPGKAKRELKGEKIGFIRRAGLPDPEGPMHEHTFKDLGGYYFRLEMPENYTWNDIRKLLSEKTKIPPALMRIITYGREVQYGMAPWRDPEWSRLLVMDIPYLHIVGPRVMRIKDVPENPEEEKFFFQVLVFLNQVERFYKPGRTLEARARILQELKDNMADHPEEYNLLGELSDRFVPETLKMMEEDLDRARKEEQFVPKPVEEHKASRGTADQQRAELRAYEGRIRATRNPMERVNILTEVITKIDTYDKIPAVERDRIQRELVDLATRTSVMQSIRAPAKTAATAPAPAPTRPMAAPAVAVKVPSLQLSFRAPDAVKGIGVDIQPTMTVGQLLKIFEDRVLPAPLGKQYTIIYKGKRLDPARTLGSIEGFLAEKHVILQLEDVSAAPLMPAAPKPEAIAKPVTAKIMKSLPLRLLTGKRINIEFPEDFTIYDIKKEIAKQENTPPQFIRIIYESKSLEDHIRPFLDPEWKSKISSAAVLHVILVSGLGISSDVPLPGQEGLYVQIGEFFNLVEGVFNKPRSVDYKEKRLAEIKGRKSEFNLINARNPNFIPRMIEFLEEDLEHSRKTEALGKAAPVPAPSASSRPSHIPGGAPVGEAVESFYFGAAPVRAVAVPATVEEQRREIRNAIVEARKVRGRDREKRAAELFERLPQMNLIPGDERQTFANQILELGD